MRTWKASALVILAAAAVVPTAGSGRATSPPSSEPPATAATATSPAAEATLPATETTPSDAVWEKIVPGGDCACADGSEFNFWVREADPTKVVLFLEGGGAGFDPTTCAFTDEETTTYDWNISSDDEPSLKTGVFDQSNGENPLADYTFVYVPYCTGDVHLGNLTREYSPDLTVEHVGMVNGDAALSYLAENFPDAEQVVVAGESAGAIATPVYAGLVSDLWPDTQITVYADGSGAYPDDPALNAGIGGLWGTFETMPAWEVNEGLTAEDWGIPRYWVQAGLHDPEIVMSRFDFAYDEVQTAFMQLTGADTSDVGASMLANEAAIEAEGVIQHSFTAPGSEHTVSSDNAFYSMEVGGVLLSDWLADVVAGEDVADVACEECGRPAPATTG